YGDFNLVKQSDHILLKWNTYSEENTKLFEVQKSDNGEGFTTIGSVLANGNSDNMNKYQYKDFGNTPNQKTYYRIKCIEINGKHTYSKVLTYQDLKDNSTDIQVFPNPAKDQLSLQISNANSEIMMCSIFNLKGELVRR